MPRSLPAWCEGPRFSLNTGGTWAANAFLGVSDDGTSTLAANIVPWIAPCPGLIRRMVVSSLSSSSGMRVKFYKASRAASPTYVVTSINALISSGFGESDVAFNVAKYDYVVAFCDTIWNAAGVTINSLFLPFQS